MKVEIWDGVGRAYVINSADFDLIGRWFAEHAKLLLSADARYNHPVQLHVWPDTAEESQLIPVYHRQSKVTQQSILTLAEHLLKVSAEWPTDYEEADSNGG